MSKMIRVDYDVWKNLKELKGYSGRFSFNDVIKYLLKNNENK